MDNLVNKKKKNVADRLVLYLSTDKVDASLDNFEVFG